MEGRLTSTAVSRPPLAVVALAVILLVTAAWWALALWPLGPGAPEWLARTREVCFGASRVGLPNAGGWILLIGEPIGLLAVLVVIWGGELRADLSRLQRRAVGRVAIVAVVLGSVAGSVAAVRRVATAAEGGPEPFLIDMPLPARGTEAAPALALSDQRGGITRLADLRGNWVVVTFAFGHCEDICPVIVRQALDARAEAGVGSIPLFVVSLDPWRDTPERLSSIATAWDLAPHDRALSGGIDEVNSTLDDWGIARARDPDTGVVVHGSVVAIVDPEGRVAWRLDGGAHRVREALLLVAKELPAPGSR